MFRLTKFLNKALQSNFGKVAPYKLNFAVTYNCNSRCINCQIWKKKPRNELTSKEIDKFFKNCSFNTIALTGGEPFLRADLEEIFASIAKNNKDLYMLTITTNGYLTKRIIKLTRKLSQYKLPFVMVTVSIDGIPKIHNKLRGLKTAFSKAIETFLKLTTIPGIRPQIGYTIFPENAGRLEEFVTYMQKKYPPFSASQMDLHTYNVSTHFYGNTKKVHRKYLALAKKDIVFFSKNFKCELSMENIGKRVFQKLSLDFLKTGKMPFTCNAMATSVFLDPQGNIYPCVIWNRKVVNIRDFNYNLNKVIETDNYQNLLKLIQKNKCPNCWTVCEGTQTMLGNLFTYKFLKNAL